MPSQKSSSAFKNGQELTDIEDIMMANSHLQSIFVRISLSGIRNRPNREARRVPEAGVSEALPST